MEIRFGTYGYLDNYIMSLIGVENGYEFTTNDEFVIRKYNFKAQKSPSGYINYRLKANKNTGIIAYQVRTFCTYKGFKFFVDSFSDGIYYTRPLEEAMKHFKDFERHGYDPMYEATEAELKEIWEERTPIDGFVFDVEPIVYLKKKDE